MPVICVVPLPNKRAAGQVPHDGIHAIAIMLALGTGLPARLDMRLGAHYMLHCFVFLGKLVGKVLCCVAASSMSPHTLTAFSTISSQLTIRLIAKT
jgi:hypothetical protein